MPQLTSLSLTDRETTPVVHTFAPAEMKDNVGILVNSQGVPVGNERTGVSLRYTGNRYKAVFTLQLPVVVNETINGVIQPKVVRTSYAEVTFNFANTSTLQERKNLVGMVYSALSSSQTMLNEVFTELKSVY